MPLSSSSGSGSALSHGRIKRKRACDKCYESKHVCAGDIPCDRCKRLGIPCLSERSYKKMGRPKRSKQEDEQHMNSSSLLQGSSPLSPSSSLSSSACKRQSYSKTACATCRRRKRKCDDFWPCSYCLYLNVECSGPIYANNRSKQGKILDDEKLNSNMATAEGNGGSERTTMTVRNRVNGSSRPNGENGRSEENGLNGVHRIGVNPEGLSIGISSNEQASSSSNFLHPSLESSSQFANLGFPDPSPLPPEDIQLASMLSNMAGSSTPSSTNSGIIPSNSNGGDLIINNSHSSAPNNNISNQIDVTSISNPPTSLLKLVMDSTHLSRKEQFYISYFVTEVSRVIFADETSDAFLTAVVPIATMDKRVRDPVLGIAAAHKSGGLVSNGGDEEEMPLNFSLGPAGPNTVCTVRDSNIYRAKSHYGIMGTTKDQEYYESNEVLLSILLTALLEVLIGSSLDWSILLEKANEIIEYRGGFKAVSHRIRNSEESGGTTTTDITPLLLQLFCYLDLVSSLSTCNSPYVERIENNIESNNNGNSNNQFSPLNLYSPDQLNEWELMLLNNSSPQNFDNFNFEDTINTQFMGSQSFDQPEVEMILNAQFGLKFGIAGAIFKLLGNISTLSSLRKYRHKDQRYENQFQQLAESIETKLQNWELPSNLNFYDVTDLQRTQWALALQWAALLRLHQIRYNYNRNDDRVKGCLHTILQAIKLIPVGSNLETGLMFPLTMAGSVAVRQDHRDLILRRIKSIKRTIKFQYISEFEKLLLNVWSRDDKEAESVNWAAVRYYEFPGLVMF